MNTKVDFYNSANRAVAILCNHQKTVSKGFENTTLLLNQQLKDMLEYCEELREHLQSFKNKGKSSTKAKISSKKDEEDDNGKGKIKRVFPDTLEKTKTTLDKLNEKIQKKEKDINNREDNKQIALNTSKLNYMDPRISVAWCKKFEVGIEKVFPRSVLDKFPWAMYTDPDYEF